MFRLNIEPMVYVGRVYIEQFIYESEEYLMARLKDEWQFVNIKLERTDQPALDKHVKSHKEDPFSALDAILSHGYKVSVSWVDKQNSYCISVSGNDNTAHNNKCTITTWSDNPMEALFMADFKVNVLCKGGDWSEHASENSNWG